MLIMGPGGPEAYARIRTLSYPKTAVFVLCFCVTQPRSFANAKELWKPELKYHSRDVPIVLVGTKIDLRADEQTVKELTKYNESGITTEMGEQLAKEIGAERYVECSALTNEGMKETFDSILIVGANYAAKRLGQPPFSTSGSTTNKPKRCIICDLNMPQDHTLCCFKCLA